MAYQRIIRGGGGRREEAHRKSIRNRRETETNFSFPEPEISRAGRDILKRVDFLPGKQILAVLSESANKMISRPVSSNPFTNIKSVKKTSSAIVPFKGTDQ